ncbi:MAG: carbon starvation protein A [Bacteroidales bacterium]|nr:carbon starvation protein A [Bacteroidales bacterium]
MTTFIVALLCLIAGYFIYGAFVERVFGINASRATPCHTLSDGVDYVPMPTWKVFLIQFLNIAGTGPIFGAIQGILFGPAAYFWIVLGCIFGGAVHDFVSSMISLRRNGESLPEIVGDELGKEFRIIVRFLSMVLMILVGTVFATTPAGLLANLTPNWGFLGTAPFWTAVIFLYYMLATVLPINKLIGKIYPVFGLVLLIMAGAIVYGIFTSPGHLPEITGAFTNHHPANNIPLFPGLCITIACGAVSGFHATQSPMMARCIKNEKYARPVFYGSMIVEGVVALIWAAAAIKFADSLTSAGATPYEKLLNLMTGDGAHGVNPAIVVNQICDTWLGKVGALLAILGVVVAPITSGDTALRCARLIAADFMHFSQAETRHRLMISLPIFAIAIALMFIDFSILWRYFAWVNQTLATLTLWTITVYLEREKKPWIIGLIPALFMTMVCCSYILIAPEGFGATPTFAYTASGFVTLLCCSFFIRWHNKRIHPMPKSLDRMSIREHFHQYRHHRDN